MKLIEIDASFESLYGTFNKWISQSIGPLDGNLSLLNWRWVLVNIGFAVLIGYLLETNKGKARRLMRAHFGSTRMRKNFSLDAKFIVTRIVFMPLLFAGFLSLTSKLTVIIFPPMMSFAENFFSEPLIRIQSDWGVVVSALVAYVLVDFIHFFTHYVVHQNKFLYRFHAIHHRATYLTPLTKFRIHPVDDVIRLAIELPVRFTVVLLSLAFFSGPESLDTGTPTLVLVLTWVGHLAFGYFRHSHIWLSYGKHISYIFISPAMHQIHHSVHQRHRNKNHGVVFSVWDYLFGTLYIPQNKESLIIGVASDQRAQNHSYFEELLFPFRRTPKLSSSQDMVKETLPTPSKAAS